MQPLRTILASMLIAVSAAAGIAYSQSEPAAPTPSATPPAPAAAILPAEQLDTLVAPIALYPDPLLSQTLVASTYPLEVIQLHQWLQRHKELKDAALAEAVQKEDWDPSIQAMASLGDVVKLLAENIKWTTELGNAFLAQQSDVGGGIAVTLVPTRHWSARGLLDRNKALWASFVLETPAGKIYVVCDSGYGEGKHFRRVAEAHGPLRLAILPIGAYEPRWFMQDQHMNPADAVKALADCGAEQALAHHHGTFQLTDEAIDAPVVALHAALEQAKISRERFVALKPGQVVEI
jgi:L-ascorbate metabolism protein UlaG (beta-lactamase superfamily)